MPETVRCPSCGHDNPAGAESCSACNFPLVPVAPGPPAAEPPGPPIPRPMRPIRPRRPRSQQATGMSLALWLLFGIICALIVVYYAVQGFVKNNAPAPVEGSNEQQQKHADELRAMLARDSTNLEARIDLADLLYDTGNWSEAIVHYRSAIARDSSRVTALVDLGVCYYNLGDGPQAEQLFQLALQRQPRLPQALFNLGIVAQARGDHKAALGYFHRALENGPPEEMKRALAQAMDASFKALGQKAPPIPVSR